MEPDADPPGGEGDRLRRRLLSLGVQLDLADAERDLLSRFLFLPLGRVGSSGAEYTGGSLCEPSWRWFSRHTGEISPKSASDNSLKSICGMRNSLYAWALTHTAAMTRLARDWKQLGTDSGSCRRAVASHICRRSSSAARSMC